MYDIAVIGGGPAGLSAAVNARARNKSVLVVTNDYRESPLYKAEWVDNYLGMPGRTGPELLEAYHSHAEAMGTVFRAGRALNIMPMEGTNYIGIGSDMEEARAVILATGVSRGRKYPGEAEFLGRGVSYCATCDGMLYRGKPVAVVGRAPDAPQEANYLKSLGCQVVYVAAREPQGLDREIPWVRANRLAVKGEQTVTALEADGADIPCAGIFILRQAVAPTDLLPQLETENGAIKVDRRMATNVDGVFAAGDCTGGPLQVAKAVGEGHTAGLSACEYLDEKQES